MVELEVDGEKVEMPEGSMVMHAASKLGVYVPHFCYHKKLSIAANCRMCLVEVEKAPKPLPACATPVSAGMKVWTASDKAVAAQKSVMEFLLINHPLDCPICDQGGECQLQDLAVGYGSAKSRFGEAKRVVFHKSMGPLISAEEMTRCIHCTRCVRFGQEIAGKMELGMAGRGEHSEIMSFLGRSVDSELSGNMIDICPVGALTSKPFRYSARTWELARRKSIAAHDSLGSNIVVQVKGARVMRVVPLENESVNECWISDRDRFSYEGLYAEDRLTTPMLKHDGKWLEVDWPTALGYAARTIADVCENKGPAAIGALASPNSTLEEMHLLAKLMRGIGSENVDFRLRQRDFSADAAMAGVPWLGMRVEELAALDGALVIGSFLRKDHPLLAARLRHATRAGARVSVLNATDDDPLMAIAERMTEPPSRWPEALARVLVALLAAKGQAVPPALAKITPDAAAEGVARALASAERGAVLLGNAAVQCDRFSIVAQIAQEIARVSGARFGYLGEGANGIGARLAGATPVAGGRNAREMVAEPLAAYLLMGIEPSLDHGMPSVASAAMSAADTVIALTSFRSPELLERADCLLPIAPFTETSGTLVNCEGRAQSFNGVTRALGETRPAWKVLRVLANLLQIPGFDFDDSEQVRDHVLAQGVESRLDNAIAGDPARWRLAEAAPLAAGQFERIADVPVNFSDALVRRASSLQQTLDARAPRARMNARTLAAIGVAAGERVKVSQAGGEALLEAALEEGAADGVVRVAAAHPSTAGLASMFGVISVVRA
ncbi:MAG: NADH-quinone oxidoreductase subunit NuoG [Burkholderiaceae bacterium]|nr:NADH-quinone oxidoreductase subunit NuoG [Burkholderiaceae bacterium]